MTPEIVLFTLRLLASIILCSVLVILFLFLWRDLRTAALQSEARRRRYGQLVALHTLDDMTVPTGQLYPLLPLTTLGRAPTNMIVLADTFASSEHALIALRDGHWWLEDRDSRNGTLLNGVPVNQAVIVTEGDEIGIGAVRFRLQLTSESDAST